MLESGVGVQKALRIAGKKTGDARAEQGLAAAREKVRAGFELATAFREQDGRFPELMVDLVDVGEQTGALPEVLSSLADHFEHNDRLRKDFFRSIAWPVFQLTAAILVIALLIFVLGMISESSGGADVDMLGWGLLGAEGALIWLVMTFGTIGGLIAAYVSISRSLHGKRMLDPILMRIPVVGACMESFALARFSWAFALTQQAGMSIEPSLRASLKATSNGAFIGATDRIWRDIYNGRDFSTALGSSLLFPDDYLNIVHVAETSGTVPEALDRLSPQFEEQAQRSLKALTSALSWVIWSAVAVFIIYIIFTIVSRYLAIISEFL